MLEAQVQDWMPAFYKINKFIFFIKKKKKTIDDQFMDEWVFSSLRIAYHARNITHLGKLMTETTGSIILHIAGKIYADPACDSSSINHFLQNILKRMFMWDTKSIHVMT